MKRLNSAVALIGSGFLLVSILGLLATAVVVFFVTTRAATGECVLPDDSKPIAEGASIPADEISLGDDRIVIRFGVGGGAEMDSEEIPLPSSIGNDLDGKRIAVAANLFEEKEGAASDVFPESVGLSAAVENSRLRLTVCALADQFEPGEFEASVTLPGGVDVPVVVHRQHPLILGFIPFAALVALIATAAVGTRKGESSAMRYSYLAAIVGATVAWAAIALTGQRFVDWPDFASLGGAMFVGASSGLVAAKGLFPESTGAASDAEESTAEP